MMCHATLVTDSAGAKAVARALNPDDVSMGELTVKTSHKGDKVTTHIECESVSTLMATVDDVLRCQITSESLI